MHYKTRIFVVYNERKVQSTSEPSNKFMFKFHIPIGTVDSIQIKLYFLPQDLAVDQYNKITKQQ